MMESEHEDDHAPKSLIVPDDIVEIVFHYGDPWITTVAGGKRMVQPRSFAVSQMRKYIEIESNGLAGFVSVRFYPWGAYHREFSAFTGFTPKAFFAKNNVKFAEL